MPRTDLSYKALRFCIEYVTAGDNNGTQAAIRAGYANSTANRRAYELLHDDRIKAEIKRIQGELPEKIGINVDRITQELAAIAFSNIGDFLRTRQVLDAADDSDNVRILPSTEFEITDLTALTQQKMAAVGEVIFGRDGQVRIKMHDKIAALDRLSRILGLYNHAIAEDPDAGREFTDLERAQRLAALVRSATEGGGGPLIEGRREGGPVAPSGEPGRSGDADAPANGVRQPGG
jgi:phage terminase small subunit